MVRPTPTAVARPVTESMRTTPGSSDDQVKLSVTDWVPRQVLSAILAMNV
jgi:hypothetical protein